MLANASVGFRLVSPFSSVPFAATCRRDNRSETRTPTMTPISAPIPILSRRCCELVPASEPRAAPIAVSATTKNSISNFVRGELFRILVILPGLFACEPVFLVVGSKASVNSRGVGAGIRLIPTIAKDCDHCVHSCALLHGCPVSCYKPNFCSISIMLATIPSRSVESASRRSFRASFFSASSVQFMSESNA